jgi:hypothetical protein
MEDELFLRRPEFGFQRAKLGGDILQFGIRKEMAQSIQEWERVCFDQRVSAALDKTQVGGGFLGKEPLVTEADEPVGNPPENSAAIN